VIPGNDDAIRASALIMRVLADGVAEGRNRGVKVSDFAVQDGDGTEAGEAEAEPAAEPAEPGAEPAEPAAEAPAEAAPAEEATPSEEASE
jgi:small subunit ribosomal protein S2